MSESVNEAPTPPFAEIYRDEPYVSPRMAFRLWAAGLYCADTWKLTADDPNDVVDMLPPIAQPWAEGAWLERFVAGFETVASRIAEGVVREDRLTNCTGEEMALHLIVDVAEGDFESGVDEAHADDLDPLPSRGEADTNFDLMRDVLFKDDDVLMLFDPSFDGIDDPDSELARLERTVNLHPRQWFLPFDDSLEG